jgi:hypothetical protein
MNDRVDWETEDGEGMGAVLWLVLACLVSALFFLGAIALYSR